MADLQTLWVKHDEHAKRINRLETVAEVHKERLDQHTEEFRIMNRDATERHTQIATTLGKYSDDMQEFVKVYHEQRGELLGAARVGKWGIALIISVVGLAVAYLGLAS